MKFVTVLCFIVCCFLPSNAQSTEGIQFDAKLSHFIRVTNSSLIANDPLYSLCGRDVQVEWFYRDREWNAPLLFIEGFDSNNKKQTIKIPALTPFMYWKSKFFEETLGIQFIKAEKAEKMLGYFSKFSFMSEDGKWNFLILYNNRSMFVLLGYTDKKKGYLYNLKPKNVEWFDTFIKQVHVNFKNVYSIARSEGMEQKVQNIQKQIKDLENDFPILKKSQIQNSNNDITNALLEFFGIKDHNESIEVGGNWVETPTEPKTSLKNLREFINKKKGCRLAGIANPDCAVVIYGDNGYYSIGCPENLLAKIKKHNSDKKKLTDINITPRKGYVLLYGRNGYNTHGAPKGLLNALDGVNSRNKIIRSANFTDNGYYCAVTEEGVYTSDGYMKDILAKAREKYGAIWTAFVSESGAMVVCCTKGVYCHNVPKKVFEAIKLFIKEKKTIPYMVKFTKGGLYVITSKEGSKYKYFL